MIDALFRGTFCRVRLKTRRDRTSASDFESWFKRDWFAVGYSSVDSALSIAANRGRKAGANFISRSMATTMQHLPLPRPRPIVLLPRNSDRIPLPTTAVKKGYKADCVSLQGCQTGIFLFSDPIAEFREKNVCNYKQIYARTSIAMTTGFESGRLEPTTVV